MNNMNKRNWEEKKLLGSEISGCYGGEYEDDGLLGHGAAESHSSL
jgi:hypothetical protein